MRVQKQRCARKKRCDSAERAAVRTSKRAAVQPGGPGAVRFAGSGELGRGGLVVGMGQEPGAE